MNNDIMKIIDSPEKMKILKDCSPLMFRALFDIIKTQYDSESTLANLNGSIANAKTMLLEEFPEIKELLK